MNSIHLRLILLFIVLVLLQVWLFNYIHLFGFATPLLYIYFLIKLPLTMNRNLVLLLAVLLGFVIDLFGYTLGVNMLAMTVAGFLRFYFLNLFTPRDLFENTVPSFATFGKSQFLGYAGSITLLHQITLFCTESLSLFDPLLLLMRIGGSFFLTMLLIIGMEFIDIDF